jgi:hypothetical protein
MSVDELSLPARRSSAMISGVKDKFYEHPKYSSQSLHASDEL